MSPGAFFSKIQEKIMETNKLPTKTVLEQSRAGTQPEPLPGYESVEASIMAIFRKQHPLSGTVEGLNYIERARSYQRGTGKQYDEWLHATGKM